jgi:hypothetical protein
MCARRENGENVDREHVVLAAGGREQWMRTLGGKLKAVGRGTKMTEIISFASTLLRA